MKPLMLHGHERSITQIKFNQDGDLLFSSAKDNHPCVWYSVNGERLGTYEGHQGVVWAIDVDWETKRFMSGGGDNQLLLWDVQTGEIIGRIERRTSVRSCQFNCGRSMAVYTTDRQMGHPAEICVIDPRAVDSSGRKHKRGVQIPLTDAPKATSILWVTPDVYFVSGHENGDLALWDMRCVRRVNLVPGHQNTINDMQLSKDGCFIITASKDCTAKLFTNHYSLKCKKTYKTESPVYSAAISPIADHVVLGGGQEAMDVTTTSTRIGEFDARFFHLVFEEEFGRVKGHFGPINSLAFHPDGKTYASGGEDGYVRVHQFDQAYFDFQLDY